MSRLAKSTKTFTLNTGAKIPAVGLGTWRANKGAAYTSTKIALANGYTHIDTASAYANEKDVGKAIAELKIDRSKLFITTKFWNTQHKDIEKAINNSLKQAKLDYFDLYLVHWPVSIDPKTKEPYKDWNYIDTWLSLQKFVDSGKVKAIGVSNFTIKKLEKLFNHPEFKIAPAVNQVELHPLLKQDDLVKYAKEKGFLLQAFSPLGSQNSPILTNKTVKEIAAKNDVDVGQLLVSWAVQRGTVVLPKSLTESRIISNLNTFEIPEEDFKILNELEDKEGTLRINDPDFNDYNT